MDALEQTLVGARGLVESGWSQDATETADGRHCASGAVGKFLEESVQEVGGFVTAVTPDPLESAVGAVAGVFAGGGEDDAWMIGGDGEPSGWGR